MGRATRCSEGVFSRQRLVVGSGMYRSSSQLRHTAALPAQSWQRGSAQRVHLPPITDSEEHSVQVCASLQVKQSIPHCTQEEGATSARRGGRASRWPQVVVAFDAQLLWMQDLANVAAVALAQCLPADGSCASLRCRRTWRQLRPPSATK